MTSAPLASTLQPRSGRSGSARNRNADDDVTVLNPASFQSSASNLPLGSTSGASAVADFNQDGISDLVITLGSSAISNNIAVFLGSGNGSFSSATLVAASGLQPLSIITGDFNQDGIPDLVTANRGSDTVSLLLGNGTGGFGTARTFRVGSQPNSVAAADFNGDGRLDLVTADSGLNENTVSVLLADANGGFQSAKSLDIAGTQPFAVTTGDFDRDGDLDIASTDTGSRSVSLFLGRGNGTFGDPEQFFVGAGTPVSIAAADFDGDNKLDLATGNLAGNGQDITVLFGDGNGEFTDVLAYAAGGGVNSLVTGDFNGDHSLDIAGAVDGSAAFVVLTGDGNGNFTGVRNTTTNSLVSGLSSGDFNRDGKPDLVSTSGGMNSASVILNETSFVVLRSSETLAEVDGSKESEYSITVNLDRNSLTINTTPTVTRTINNFEDVLGTQVKDSITGSNDRNFLSGNGGQDTLTGLGGNDTILGGEGNDKIKGDAGNDRLTGSTGNDRLTGGDGKDRFIFDHGKAFATSDGNDRITDFEKGIDKIVLDRGTFTALRQQISFASVQGVAAAKSNRALVTYVRSTGRLYYNQNGNAAGFGSGGLFVTIDGANSSDGRLTASDVLTQR
ncbi:MAG: hypothetical protein HC827_07020 [Cyanobacteria bacterium RM1_2_2]|nr:hypothetical protein [Cyanobacteria bacterium RM1_2_2]